MSSYELLGCGNHQRIERFGEIVLSRPCNQAPWPLASGVLPERENYFHFERLDSIQGKWNSVNPRGLVSSAKNAEDPVGHSWIMSVEDIKLHLKLTAFGHVGFFPEHVLFWQDLQDFLGDRKSPVRILSLFAYTGALTCHLAKFCQSIQLPFEIVHVDASKSSVDWANKNLELNQIKTDENHAVRWIVEDARKFISREIRRGRDYDLIVLDPPSYGRGVKNEIWKTDFDLYPLLFSLETLLKSSGELYLTSHSQGHSPLFLKDLLSAVFPRHPEVIARELYLPSKISKQGVAAGSLAFLENRGKASGR